MTALSESIGMPGMWKEDKKAEDLEGSKGGKILELKMMLRDLGKTQYLKERMDNITKDKGPDLPEWQIDKG